MPPLIREFRQSDLPRLEDITEAAFPAASIDRLIELRHGRLGTTDWAARKRADVARDCAINPAGVFVAEIDGQVVGYVTCQLDYRPEEGWIHNLAVAPEAHNRGLGRLLLERALEYLKAAGMRVAQIETLATNEVGNHLYPAVGFVELCRQVYFTKEL